MLLNGSHKVLVALAGHENPNPVLCCQNVKNWFEVRHRLQTDPGTALVEMELCVLPPFPSPLSKLSISGAPAPFSK